MNAENTVISVKNAKEHNLKNIDIDIPKNQIVAVTGPSGSGKSTLVFNTVYTEARRQYLLSLSPYARQFLDIQEKPDATISGLSPAIAIDQKTTSRNPRSTVSTATEIYDYMRILFARVGTPYSPATGLPIEKQSPSQMVEKILSLPQNSKVFLLSPVVRGHKGEYRKELLFLRKQGYERFKIDGIFYEYDEIETLDKNKKHTIEVVVDRLVLEQGIEARLADSIETALKLSNGIINLEIVEVPEGAETKHKKGDVLVFSENFSCPVSGFSLTEIEPRIFSFNSPYGACKECDGLGYKLYFDPKLIVPNPKLSLKEGAIVTWSINGEKATPARAKFYLQTLEALANHYDFSLYTPFEELPENIQNIILHGSEDEITFNYSAELRISKIKKRFEGVIGYLQSMSEKSKSNNSNDQYGRYQIEGDCHKCKGHRLREESLCVKIADKHIGEITKMTVLEAIDWFESLKSQLTETQLQIAHQALREITQRLGFLKNVGLSYLTLNRKASTLSGGESQRIRLASQIGSGLSGVIYVLDEPSIGLHQSDNDRLLQTIKKLKDLGNTVIIVEHDEDTMWASDYIVDMGLGAGIHGGDVIATGTPKEIANDSKSITGKFLSGREKIEIPKNRRQINPQKVIKVEGACSNNLKNINVSVPLGTFTVITGVSGSGKSTFTIQTLYKAIARKLNHSSVIPGKYDRITGIEFIDKIIEIDQSPIGRTPRSNPATYTGAFTPIRDWYTALPKAKVRGYKPGRFSFNVKGGRCETCEGDGVLKIEMHLLPDVYVKCEECHGQRYNKETLEIKYQGKSIAEVLGMNVDDATAFFSSIPLVHEKLVALQEVGLGYMKIGQPATTLSGGEAQRVKLAKELSRKSTGRTLYILDEPTTGLHSCDIKRLLKVLQKLVDAGNTILVIEHNLDVIKTADHIIDIGPYGGDRGGELVATGTPEQVAANERSITGQYLKKYI